MAKKLLTGLLIDVKKQTFETVTIPDDNEEFYKLLECDLIDIQTRKFNGISYDIICDDEGLFIEDNKPAVATFNAKTKELVEVIVGKCLLVKGDNSTGELVSLTQKEIENLLKCKNILTNKNTNASYNVLFATI